MKHLFTFLSLIMAVNCFSQSQSTRTYLVMYDKQINADSLAASYRLNRTPADERSSTTLQMLRQISASSGQATEAFLQAKMADKPTGEIKYNKLWIVNALLVEAPSELAYQMANTPQVAMVEDITDQKAYHISPVRMEEDVNRAIGAAEPGLIAVGVRFLWDLGYTGKGLKLMSFDTGIWPTHPALGGRFYGEYVPMHLAWNGIHSPVPADKSSSHGTHTVGTMAGLDTLTNDTIGLAFNAYFMATDPIVSNLADTIGMANIMLAYQWTLDPDNDPNTTDDMPAVMCNSWGTDANAGFCGSFVADMLEVIDLTGIANEYSAGNEGPGVSTTGVPALTNPGIVNAFAVGAVNGNTPGYPIASFSSRGPTPCLGTGSLQIKPEVVAPGVSVRSCVKLDGYSFYDGTSMAGPHAAGLMVLLKEAFPTVAGETLKEALYYSAVDLGAPGEDNIYGMGMIHAESAYNWLINEGYTPVPPVSVLPELVLEKAPAGVVDLVCTSPVTNTIYLYNEGSVSINDTVYFTANFNGTVVGQWAQHIQLAPQQRMQITNPNTFIPITGTNELWISAKQKSTPVEKDMINNNRTWRFTYYPEKTVPYTESFEVSGLKDIQWTVYNPDLGRTFETFNTGGQDAGTKSAAIRFVFYSPAAGQQDMLISPPVQLNNNGNHKVAFDIAYQKKTQTQKDTVSLLASLDCGLTFNEVIFVGSPNEMVTFTSTTPSNFIPTEPAHWKRLTFDIPTAWNGQSVLFAFRSVNNRGANAFIDDFSVFLGNDPLTVDEHTPMHISVFPNPFSNQIHIQFNESVQHISLELFDVSGRKMDQTQQANLTSVMWEPSAQLPAGIYFLKVKGGNKQSVFKLIKQ